MPRAGHNPFSPCHGWPMAGRAGMLIRPASYFFTGQPNMWFGPSNKQNPHYQLEFSGPGPGSAKICHPKKDCRPLRSPIANSPAPRPRPQSPLLLAAESTTREGAQLPVPPCRRASALLSSTNSFVDLRRQPSWFLFHVSGESCGNWFTASSSLRLLACTARCGPVTLPVDSTLHDLSLLSFS